MWKHTKRTVHPFSSGGNVASTSEANALSNSRRNNSKSNRQTDYQPRSSLSAVRSLNGVTLQSGSIVVVTEDEIQTREATEEDQGDEIHFHERIVKADNSRRLSLGNLEVVRNLPAEK